MAQDNHRWNESSPQVKGLYTYDKHCDCDGSSEKPRCKHAVLEYELYDNLICAKALRINPCAGTWEERRMCPEWRGNPGGR